MACAFSTTSITRSPASPDRATVPRAGLNHLYHNHAMISLPGTFLCDREWSGAGAMTRGVGSWGGWRSKHRRDHGISHWLPRLCFWAGAAWHRRRRVRSRCGIGRLCRRARSDGRRGWEGQLSGRTPPAAVGRVSPAPLRLLPRGRASVTGGAPCAARPRRAHDGVPSPCACKALTGR